MNKNTFGKTGLSVTPIGFGGGPIGYLGTQGWRVARILNELLDLGVNVIDTAECYPGSEEAIAAAVGHRRKEYVLITKCGHKVDGTTGSEWSGQLVSETVDRSLRRLRTDVIDVVLLHSCNLETLRKGEVLDALVRAREAGKVRFVGYSGDNEAAAHAAGHPEVSVVMTSVNICDQVNIDGVLPKAKKAGVGVAVKRPLANAAWRAPSEQAGIYVEYSATYRDRLSRMGLTPADLGFDGPADIAWPEIALRFTLSQPGVSTAIIGTTNPERIRSNIAAAEKGPLPKEVIAQIRDAFRKAEAASGERWKGQT
jgi:aryl-alcohol dehydrogenase-like predicted oxidoreductase